MRPSHPGRVSGTGDLGVASGRYRALIVGVAVLALLITVLTSMMWFRASRATEVADEFPAVTSVLPPARGGYFRLLPVGAWSTLPSDGACAQRIHYSTWEPRPDNTGPNQVMPDVAAVHRAFAARPLAIDGNVDPRWDTWLLQRVDGQFTGTTDEIFQWVACKWGLPDDLLRAVAVRETSWYQYETYASGRPVRNWGSGDLVPPGTAGASVYCTGIAKYGRDYQQDYGLNICPETFSIVGIKSWQAPQWGPMLGSQNGTFPFSRESTAFAVDYLGSQLRGCYEGWKLFLGHDSKYTAGDIWGCIGAWYSGDWHTARADSYISRVKDELTRFAWLQPGWRSVRPRCDATHGCPLPGRL
jgi:hypothetical protein